MSVRAKICSLILAATVFTVVPLLRTVAQSSEPQMVITWRAYGSYIPPKYQDKALPNQESELTASLELLVNGKPVDLSRQTIYWYLNNTPIGNTLGEQYIVFSPFGTPPAFLTLKVELPNYNGNLLTHEIQIPLVSPKAVIESPHPTGQSSENPITLQGTPYFFYTSDPGTLSYVWSVNGQTSAASGNPQILQINLDPATPSGSSLDVSLSVNNPNDSMSSNDSTNIVYLKQL
jgi:hypothetical protein